MCKGAEFQSLKALGLIRSSRCEEAWSLLEEIEKDEPTEEHTLQALTHCFKDLARCKLAVLFRTISNSFELFLFFSRSDSDDV